MKALSVRQPWAWLIVAGYKDVENRSWRTDYRGRLLIHASQTADKWAMGAYQEQAEEYGYDLPDEYPTGAIVGSVELVDCVEQYDSEWFEGPIGWILDKPEAFASPIPAKGKLGLWEAPDTFGE
jgi:hypothetical protein